MNKKKLVRKHQQRNKRRSRPVGLDLSAQTAQKKKDIEANGRKLQSLLQLILCRIGECAKQENNARDWTRHQKLSSEVIKGEKRAVSMHFVFKQMIAKAYPVVLLLPEKMRQEKKKCNDGGNVCFAAFQQSQV